MLLTGLMGGISWISADSCVAYLTSSMTGASVLHHVYRATRTPSLPPG